MKIKIVSILLFTLFTTSYVNSETITETITNDKITLKYIKLLLMDEKFTSVILKYSKNGYKWDEEILNIGKDEFDSTEFCDITIILKHGKLKDIKLKFDFWKDGGYIKIEHIFVNNIRI